MAHKAHFSLAYYSEPCHNVYMVNETNKGDAVKAATRITKVTRDIFAEVTSGPTNQYILHYSVLKSNGRRFAPSTVDKHILLLINLGIIEGSTCQVTGNAELKITIHARKDLDLGINPLLDSVLRLRDYLAYYK